MRIFKFNNRKYGSELQVDAGSIESFAGYFFEYEEHATDFYELIFIESGSGSLFIDNREITIAKKMIIFISPFRKRKWLVNKKSLKCRFLLFRESFLNEYLKNNLFLSNLPFFHHQHQHFLFPPVKEWKELTELTNRIIAEIHHLQADSHIFLQSQLVYLLNISSRSYLRLYKIPVANTEHNLAHQFRHLLDAELNADYGVDHYAKKLLTTRVTLNKYCNHVFGVNAGDLVRQRLVFEIKSGLLYSNQTINEIAGFLGFREPSNLTRFFKHLTGLTPSGYRKMYQHGLYFH